MSDPNVNALHYTVYISETHKRTFTSFKSLKEYLHKSWDDFSPIIKLLHPNQIGRYEQAWNPIRNLIRNYDPIYSGKNLNDDQRRDITNAATNYLKTLNQSIPFWDKLKALSEERSPQAAACYLSAHHNWPIPRPEQPDSMFGIILYYLESGHITTNMLDNININSYVEKISNLHDETTTRISETTSHYEEVASKAEHAQRRINHQVDEAARWRQHFSHRMKQVRRGLKNRLHRQLRTIQTHYNSEIALLSPVRYWETKAAFHRRRVLLYGILLTSSMALSLVLVALLSIAFIIPLEHFYMQLFGLSAAQDSAQTTTANPIAKATAFAALIGLLFWILRIISRNLLSHQHLVADADERAVMTKTYLSLQNDNKLPDDATLEIILKALFRPASSGFVKEDHGPMPPIIELLMNRK